MLSRILAALALTAAMAAVEAAPRIKTVKLNKFTTLTVELVPDMGTRFVFPFVLDEQDEYVPFTLNITNPVFVSDRVAGRNSFVVKAPAPKEGGQVPTYYGNMFVTVAGYEISVELRTTSSLTSHYSDVVFELGDAERESLVQQGIKQRTQALEDEYRRKFEELDQLADQKAIARVGVLAMRKPGTDRIKEEVKKTLTNGDRMVLYVDKAITYEPYTIFVFELSNDSISQGLSVLDAKLFALNPDTKSERPLDAAKDVPPRVMPGGNERGVITTVGAQLNPKEVLKLQVLTDKGAIEAQW